MLKYRFFRKYVAYEMGSQVSVVQRNAELV
jgi:hypothetical protein